ncbi:hypothetical protein PVAND_013587 [Polypedilum vanderplanki]|uniref:Uncharacterized protein n=1 Tax=Polypedilum vanderplanki TaxID=319348 RepID=A0A9J6CQX2_POLVA|nr:hypothetical protein PVAND_013587 [Polypedilum vanderplanki]
MVDCRQIKLDVLQSFLSAFEFIFANKELSIDNIKFIGTENNEENNNDTYVEASVHLTSEKVQVLKKLVVAESIHYQIDQNEVSKEQFTKTLKDLGLFYSYTSFFMPMTLERIANLSDESRAELIDELCNNDETRAIYKRLEVQIEECRVILKHRNDQIKEFTADKKAAKLNIENESKMHEIENKMKEQNQEYNLLKIFHNKQEMESAQNELVNFFVNYSQLIAEYEQSLSDFRSKTISHEDFIIRVRESYNQYKKLNTLRLKKVMEKVKHENEMKVLKEKKSRFNRFEKSKNIEQVQAKLKEVDDFLKQLNNQNEKFNGTFDEYCKVQMDILKQHPKYICYIACQKLENQIEMVKTSKENYHRSIKNIEENSIKINQELKHAKNNHTKVQLEKAHLETLAQEQKTRLSNYERIIHAYERLLAKNRLKFNPRIQLIAESLKKQFPNEVIGILSDLFETNEPQHFPIVRNGIIELLGKKGDAIIVRDSKVLKKCMDFVLSLGSVDVTFVPMDSFEKEYTETVIPDNIGTPIESYIKAYNPVIKNILMEYLQPMIVSNVNSHELSIFEAVSKKISVTNFQNAINLSSDGINVFSNLEKMHTENKHKEIILHLKEMRLAEVAKRIELAETRCKLKDLDHHIENAAFYVNSLTELLERLTKKLEKFKMELEKIEDFMAKDFSAHEQMYAKMKEEFQGVIAENFQSALSKFGLESIEEFLIISNRDGNYVTNSCALLKVQDVYKKLVKTFPNSAFAQELSNRIEVFQKECDAVAVSTEEENIDTNTDSEISVILVEKEKCDQLNEKLCNLTISSNELHLKLSHSANDTFLSLNNTFMKCDEISGINSERLTTILDIPQNDDDDAINEDSNYILDILNKLEVDTSDLDESLKTETNIPKKIRQMELDLKSFSKALEKFPVLIEGDKEGLKEINHSIRELKTKINKTSKEYEEFTDIFKNARISRMKSFNKCLEVLNEEIAKFCRISLNDVTAELKPIDEVEPYLNKLQFFWRAEGNEEVLDESKKNNLAALAFLLGILKFKNQRQINYINNTTVMAQVCESLEKYVESNETDLQCNILNLNETAKYNNAIVPVKKNFNILNHDDNLY